MASDVDVDVCVYTRIQPQPIHMHKFAGAVQTNKFHLSTNRFSQLNTQ